MASQRWIATPAIAASSTRSGSGILKRSRSPRLTSPIAAVATSRTACCVSTIVAPPMAPAAAAVAPYESLDLRVVPVADEPAAGNHHAGVDRREDGHAGDHSA